MLFEIAIGDSYAAAYEYTDYKIIKEFNNGYTYRKHPIHNIKPGCYTDDTQMSIAIAEYMIEGKSFKDQIELSNKFFQVYCRDKRTGYSGGFQKLLDTCLSGKEMFERIQKSGRTEKNGAAMRACPIGLYDNIDLVKEYSYLQGSITHKGRGLIASQAVSLSVFFYKNKIEGNLDSFLNRELNLNEDWYYDGPIESKNDLGMITAKGALTVVQTCNSMHDAIVQSVALTGDVDTVAAIVCGIMSVRKDIKNNIPPSLIYNLENDQYGKDYLINLDNKLNEIYY